MFKRYLISLVSSPKDSLANMGLLVLRFSISTFMILLHGWPKLMNYSEGKNTFPELLGLGPENGLILAIFAEIICSFLLALGILSRIVVIPLAFTMLVASFIVNADQNFIVKEKALIYFIIYLFFMLVGAGKYSIDHYIKQKITPTYNQ